MSSTTASAAAIAAVLKAHTAEREARKQKLDRTVENVLIIADDLENNCRAALGMQLNNCVTNQHLLEASVKSLRQQVAALGKQCTAYGAQYEGLVQLVNEVGPIDGYLKQTDAALQRIGDNFDFIAAKLSEE
jgi:hypothetical protein